MSKLYTANQIIQAHNDLGKLNEKFLNEINSISEKSEYLRWRIIVLFYRILLPMKGYLLLKKDLTPQTYENIDHSNINSFVLCRNELGTLRAKYIELYKLSWWCRYHPFEIKDLNEKVLDEYSESVEELLDKIKFS